MNRKITVRWKKTIQKKVQRSLVSIEVIPLDIYYPGHGTESVDVPVEEVHRLIADLAFQLGKTVKLQTKTYEYNG